MNTIRRVPRPAWPVILAVCSALAVGACGGSGSGDATSNAAASSAVKAVVKAPSGLVHDGTITFGTDFTFPPYESIVGGKQEGFDIEVGKLIGQEMGLKVQHIDARFAALIPSLQARKFDAILSAIYITPERAKQVDFIPYFNTGNVLIAKKGSAYQPKQPIDMCGHTFATNQGSYVEQVGRGQLSKQCQTQGKPPVNVKSFPSDALAFQEVAAGRADVTFSDVAVTKWRIGKDPQFGLAVTSRPGSLFYPTPSGLAVRKGNASVEQALQQAIQHLEADGKLTALRKKYGLAPPDQKQVDAAVNAAG